MFLETVLADAAQRNGDDRRPPPPISGTWRNKLGSTMRLEVDRQHRITGVFHTGVGVDNLQAQFPVVGFAEGDALAFCVDFGGRSSVAAWAGHHVANEHGEQLISLWHLARPVKDPHQERDVWASLLAGSDEFTRQSD